MAIATIPEQLPYSCECGAFTHDPDTGEPCATCNPVDYAQRSTDLVRLVGGPFDGTFVARPLNASVKFRVDPPEKRVQKHVTYGRRESDDAYEFESNSWTMPHEPRTPQVPPKDE